MACHSLLVLLQRPPGAFRKEAKHIAESEPATLIVIKKTQCDMTETFLNMILHSLHCL